MNTEKMNVGGILYDICDAKAREMISDEYNTGKEYVEGDICIQDNKLYRAKAATTGVWDSTKWEEKPLAEIIREQNSKIIYCKTYTNTISSVPSGQNAYFSIDIDIPDGYEIGAVTLWCGDGTYGRIPCLYSSPSSRLYGFVHNAGNDASNLPVYASVLFVPNIIKS